jgi:hypothetical protein
LGALADDRYSTAPVRWISQFTFLFLWYNVLPVYHCIAAKRKILCINYDSINKASYPSWQHSLTKASATIVSATYEEYFHAISISDK